MTKYQSQCLEGTIVGFDVYFERVHPTMAGRQGAVHRKWSEMLQPQTLLAIYLYVKYLKMSNIKLIKVMAPSGDQAFKSQAGDALSYVIPPSFIPNGMVVCNQKAVIFHYWSCDLGFPDTALGIGYFHFL